MKIKLFTHTDLDGVSCAILAFAAFGKENVDVTYCDYHDINEKVNEFLNQPLGEYDLVLITDISVDKHVAERIDFIHKISSLNFVLLDHHETAEWLNQYDWAQVYFQHETGENTAGASMLLVWLAEKGPFTLNQVVAWEEGFVEKVRRYDTWDWANIYNDPEPKQLNDLFWIYGRDRFIDMVLDTMDSHGKFFFSEVDNFILQLKQEEIDRYIEKCSKKLTVKPVGRYNVGVVFAEMHINDVAHALHKQHPELDLIAVINMNSRKVSYRTEREDIDVSHFARYFGGGGRRATAGSQISDEKLGYILEMIFNVRRA